MTNPLEAMTTPAPVPSNEIERLAALRRYNILDTPPEAAFDRIRVRPPSDTLRSLAFFCSTRVFDVCKCNQ
jgi:hypothetical protein